MDITLVRLDSANWKWSCDDMKGEAIYHISYNGISFTWTYSGQFNIDVETRRFLKQMILTQIIAHVQKYGTIWEKP